MDRLEGECKLCVFCMKVDCPNFWTGVCNNHPVGFALITGFVLNVGKTAMVFGLKFVFLEFVLLFKGLHDFWVVSNVKKSCCVLLCSSSCFGVGGASVSNFLKCPIYFLSLLESSVYCILA